MKKRTWKGKRIVAAVIAAAMGLQMTVTALAQMPLSAEPSAPALSSSVQKELRLWYDEPAPNSTDGWEKWSLPLGCGYMGANVFGRTDSERIQITENSLANPYGTGSSSFRRGLNNFSETYIDFNHNNPANYTRELSLNDSVAHVQYDYDGVTYNREYFTSYPDKIMAVKLTASQAGKLSFTLRPTIPYIKDYNTEPGDGMGKSGTVTAEGDTITLEGNMHYYDIDFEGQYKVIPTGGSMTAQNDDNGENGTITVTDADSAVILIAVGTNYIMQPDVFTLPAKEKLANNPHPHEKVSKIISDASAKSYDELLSAHKADYQKYFNRVNLDLGGEIPSVTTDQLLNQYKKGTYNPYLEELYFQYGRYLLICSSREGCLPANLQGIWNVYDSSPWSAGYWHNINVQMNYWPAFNTNLAEMFESYADFNESFRNAAQKNADKYLAAIGSDLIAETGTGENGWAVGTGVRPYDVGGPSAGGHSGPGTGGFTTKLFWDYYDFTQDDTVLSEHTYPAIAGMAKFLSKTLIEQDDKLLVYPSASPENANNKQTTGCAFDQQMVYENHADLIKAAQLLGKEDDAIAQLAAEQVDRLDPVVVGYSGQVKEYREENYYGEFGEYKHRHISQLCGLYPGTSISSNTPAWMDAAKVTLNERGDQSTGWAMAHRLNLWARTGDGNRAYKLYQTLLKNGTLTNLWDTHPPFQIDGNFGGTAGVAEMLLQSHEGSIAPLAALPSSWSDGSYRGLVARGNFEVNASWSNKQADRFEILSKSGGTCNLKYYNVADATVKTTDGSPVSFTNDGTDRISFETEAGQTYVIENIPTYKATAAPTNLSFNAESDGTVNLGWNASGDAASYNVYKAVGSAPDYTLISSDVKGTSFSYTESDLNTIEQCTYRVTAVSADGRESAGITTLMLPMEQPAKVTGYFVEDTTLMLSVSPVDGANGYVVYKKTADGSEKVLTSPYETIYLENVSADDAFEVSAFSTRESKATAVELVDTLEIENVMLNKAISADRTVNSSYPLKNAVDGNPTTRYAVADKAGPYNVEIDLGGSYPLNNLQILEWKGSDEKGKTRSSQTSIAVYDGTDWKTVIDKQSLSLEDNLTSFDLGGAVGSKVRITFNNVGGNNKSATIYEISCSSALPEPVVKTDLFNQLIKASEINTTTLVQTPAISAFHSAKKAAAVVLNNPSATAEEVASAAAELTEALNGLEGNLKTNILYKKPLTVSAPAQQNFKETNMVDGDIDTRYAGSDNGRDLTVTIDLGGRYTLDILRIREYIGPEGTTRGGKTSIEVFDNDVWTTVVQDVSLTDNVPSRAETEFDLGGAVGSKIRLNFYNTYSSTKRITICEIGAAGEEILPLDPQPLADAIGAAKTIPPNDYTEVSYQALQEAIAAAEQVFLTATTQQELDDAVIALQAAVDALEYKPTEEVNKTILEKVIAKAELLLTSDEYLGAISSVQQSFSAALEEAKQVNSNPAATADAVERAWVRLMTEIHKLGLQQGEKTLLREHFEAYSELDLNNYMDGIAKENFKSALAAAEEMLANSDAVQSEVDAVDEALVLAAQALVLRADKTALQNAVDQTASYKADDYAKGWAAFEAARDAANVVLSNDNATQDEIDQAVDALISAMLELRYKADKSLLEALVSQAQALDLSGYSASSVQAFQSALNKAAGTLANQELSTDEQKIVNQAADELISAVRALAKVDGTPAGLTVNGDGTIQKTAGSVKTGDATPLTVGVAALLLSGVFMESRRRKKSN